MALKKYPLDRCFVDGENRPLQMDQAYSVSNITIEAAIDEILQIHGHDIALLPFSGASAGAGVFQRSADRPVIGLHIQAVVSPVVKLEEDVDIEAVKLDEIIIDAASRKIYAGSGINLDQLNQALADQLGQQFRVLGADLTSYTYAQVGATFMTGGMGPQRRYFSDSVRSVALHDGARTGCISGDDLHGYAGTYGWTGIVSAVCCEYVELPFNEVAFALPVNNTGRDLGRLLTQMSPFTRLDVRPESVCCSVAGDEIILGLEHVTVDSMQPFLNSGDNELTGRTMQLKENCKAAAAGGIIFVSGFSPGEVDEFLLRLVDDAESDTPTIAGIALEHAEVFNDPEQMRAIREGIPYAARVQSMPGRFNYKGHTDVTIRLNPDRVEESMNQLWRINEQYVHAVEACFDRHESVNGEILVYGHLNPYGVDPHNRVTFSCDNEKAFLQVKTILDEQKCRFIRNLAKLCEETGSDFIGGEKSAGSEYEMLPAWESADQVPPLLMEKFERQRKYIQAASPLFNWRAMSGYL